jgi:protein-S-isoprenylcysteine O-methyltransferase Ste14
VAVQPAHRLKTDGVYRFVRHPSYLGALLAMAGWTLVFRSGPGLLLALLMIPFVLVRIAFLSPISRTATASQPLSRNTRAKAGGS